jgi:hypothetical protein
MGYQIWCRSQLFIVHVSTMNNVKLKKTITRATKNSLGCNSYEYE